MVITPVLFGDSLRFDDRFPDSRVRSNVRARVTAAPPPATTACTRTARAADPVACLSGRAEAPGCVSHRRCARLSGRAEAPGCVSHRRCARWQWRCHRVVRAVCPRAAARRLNQAEAPRLDHARRAVDVNRPVTPRCVPAATLAGRLQTFTEGLTSTAPLYRFFVVLDRKRMPFGGRPRANATSETSSQTHKHPKSPFSMNFPVYFE